MPASYYYEWEHFVQPDGRKKTGSKYIIHPKDASVCYFAGLYRMENGWPHFTVLTRIPGEDIRFIHDRMPVILKKEMIRTWISPGTKFDEVRKIADTSLTDVIYEKTE